MKDDKRQIKTTRLVYPQIYAYTLPERVQNMGWQKIGYTEQADVRKRIEQQVHTAGINERYELLWSAPAFYLPHEQHKDFKDYELHRYLVRNNIERSTDDQLGREWFYFDGTPERSRQLFDQFIKRATPTALSDKVPYTLRREQAQAVEQTLRYIQDNRTVDFAMPNSRAQYLWNAKPRFGKTLTTYDLIKRLGARNVLIVTNRPAIADSWYGDYRRFVEGYYFISETGLIRDEAMTRAEYLEIMDQDKKQITFLSLQDLKGARVFGGKYDKLEWIADLGWDLLVIDEAHEGVDTRKTDKAFERIKRRFTLHLSGTPFKALADNKFAGDQIFNWSYLDEQKAKEAELAADNEAGAHTDMPDLRLFNYKISEATVDTINEGVEINGKRVAPASDLNEFFRVGSDGRFIYEADVQRFLDLLTTNEKYPFSTPELRNELKHTFWLVGNRVNSAKAMEKLLRRHPVFCQYKIVLAAGDGKSLSDDDEVTEEMQDTTRNERSIEKVRQAIAKHDKTITLSVGQLTTGVTIKEWSAVLMLSDIKQETLYTQAIFRAQNPYQYVDAQGELHRKQSAYVFDFSLARVLEVYDKFANSLNEVGATGKITEVCRRENVGQLLNFFPVISEDDEGRMVELSAGDVLTLPKARMAVDVVKHRFITNLLFKDIGVVYNIPAEVMRLANKLSNTTDTGKVANKNREDVQPDPDRGERTRRRINLNRRAIFGEKIYGDQLEQILDDVRQSTPDDFGRTFTDKVMDGAVEPLISKWVETYSPTKSDQAEMRQSYTSKIKQVAQEYSSSDQAPADAKRLVEATADIIENDLPRDMVDEREEAEYEREEKSDLDIIRSKLRTFTRAIPSFVMASSHPSELNIDNIETVVNDDDFSSFFTDKEVLARGEKFTKDDFRVLRDGGDYEENGVTKHFDGFFDKYVFNASIQEFAKKRRDLADYLRVDRREDIFSYIPPQRSNQIFTPRRVVNRMLDILEQYNPGVFSDPTLTFCDLYVKSGLYLAETAKRLFKGLVNAIPDENARIRHIFERQLYGFAPTRIIADIARNYIYGSYPVSSDNLVQRDLTDDFKKGENLDMRFDVVIGNPPYQENDTSIQRESGAANASASPIYHLFINEAMKVSDAQCFVVPSRWAMGAGKGLKKFTEKMLNDQHIQSFSYFTDSKDVFPNNDIKGGICYFVRNKNYTGKAKVTIKDAESEEKTEKFLNEEGVGVFVPYVELADILGKVRIKTPELEKENIQEIVSVLKPYGLRTDFFRNQIKYNLPSVSTKKQNDDDIEIIGLDKGKRVSRFIPRDYPLPVGRDTVGRWKVFIPYAYGCGALGETIPSPILGSPIQICTETYLRIGSFKTEFEAESLLKYIETKFFRVMVGILKTTQHSTTTYRYVPLQDFTADSDIDWTRSIPEIDRQLYNKYGLDDREIRFIEEKVKEME